MLYFSCEQTQSIQNRYSPFRDGSVHANPPSPSGGFFMNHISVIVNDLLKDMEYRVNINEMTISFLESKIRDGDSIDVKTRANIVKRFPCFTEKQKHQVIKLLDLIPMVQ